MQAILADREGGEHDVGVDSRSRGESASRRDPLAMSIFSSPTSTNCIEC